MRYTVPTNFLKFLALIVAFASVCFASAGVEKETEESVESSKVRPYGVIKGVVKDKRGKPISKATVAIFKLGTTKLLKQVTATKTGRFLAKVVPGTYSVLAVAQGFNPVSLARVRVKRNNDFVYGFRLERAGSGRTLSDKRADKSSSKWGIRSSRRSIYQADETDQTKTPGTDVVAAADADEPETIRPGASIVESFAGTNRNGTVKGVNFATLRPVGEDGELLIAGQVSSNGNGSRLQTSYSFNANDKNRIRLRGTVSRVGDIIIDDQREQLSQLSVQALNQWRVKDGVVLVLGFDYSKFVGAGKESSFAPRVGFQYDLDSKTRVRAAYTTRNEPTSWTQVRELEGSPVVFSDPVAVRDISLDEKGLAEMNRNTRFEAGLERVLDNRTSVEASVFLDTFNGLGVGLDQLPLGFSNGFENYVARQEGSSTGFRSVINRRLNGYVSVQSGYAFGMGQELSGRLPGSPGSLFQGNVFQTVFGGLDVELDSGTTMKAVYRLSPDAAVFAIDPFEGRLAIFDPGLSLVVTQTLPKFGLPIDAEATIDARNLFDRQMGIDTDSGRMSLTSQRRAVRGSIMVRF